MQDPLNHLHRNMQDEGPAAAEQEARDGDHTNIIQVAINDLHHDGAAARHKL